MRNVLLALVIGCSSAVLVSALRADEEGDRAAIRRGMIATQDDAPVGAVSAFAGPRAQLEPGGWLHARGWRLCDGASLARADYAELFAVVGDAHGTNPEQTHFHVPDLRGRFVRGVDSGAAQSEGMRGRDPQAPARSRPQTGAGGSGNAGDRVGSLQLDAFQGHKHKDLGHRHKYTFFQAPYRVGDNADDRNCEDVAGTGKTHIGYAQLTDPVESNHGKPRFGPETRPVNIALNWIIKAKLR